ncbi:MAG: Lrp/AsnC family transcriptional regulator [Nanoarchaeota archaeon]|nr:Lrp/AsnC family transcriptional regulator [Nanoarchaeota archaeon]MBU1004478.1 Lrp/AsnC family transcriptional regulator [Nanoarchaeota archaeon]MBU1945648.1 Lrp/AsnC family transcriptional regulator [Nanoarchaeota archaeon]
MIPRKDLLILAELRNNSRESLTEISKRTSVPISTIFDKLRFYQDNLIKKHTTIIDFSKLGFNARANIMVKVDRNAREDARKFLLHHLNVNSVYKISNGFDFLIEGVFKNVRDVEDFIDVFGGKFKLEQTQVHYIVEDIKKESFMNDNSLLDMVL